MSKVSPDYGFNNGLLINVHNFTKNSGRELTVSRHELLGLPNSDQNPGRDERVAEQMRHTFATNIGGTAVEYTVIGPEDATSVMYALYGWGGNTRHPVAVNEAQVLAAQMPDRQIVFTNVPGAGKSDLLPKSLERAVREGNYSGYGELVAQATAPVIDGRPVHLRGHSLGARTALAMSPSVHPETLIINDPTGSKKMSLGSIAWKFVVREGMHLGEYVKAGFDPKVAELQKAPVGAVLSDTGNDVKGSLRHQFFVDPVGLSRETLETSLVLAAPNVLQELRVILPDMSALNDSRAIEEIVGRISGVTDASVEAWILHGHTHSWMAGAPSVEALLYNEQSPLTLA